MPCHGLIYTNIGLIVPNLNFFIRVHLYPTKTRTWKLLKYTILPQET
ncbi:hypothetical protein HDE70_002411 [Pedobacter cryoconitis]|nr:hypothetical protein [Pedobacter cryoconitis]